ncbi:MAG: hypothetical protein LBL58_17765 [Tannerellaceae bacterium]|jgi:hypothetical protein|nr:hypothetical protein [Tannerellaceae bacterium]
MRINNISNVEGLIHFVSENSTWSPVTISNAVSALGYRKNGALESLKGLSSCLVDCPKHGAACGIQGFTMYNETVKFFRENRRDIVRNIELTAKTIGKETETMIQGFGVYRGQHPPSISDISIAPGIFKTNNRRKQNDVFYRGN